jgi:hypothetical protein
MNKLYSFPRSSSGRLRPTLLIEGVELINGNLPELIVTEPNKNTIAGCIHL